MTRSKVATAAIVVVTLLAVAIGLRHLRRDVHFPPPPPAATTSTAPPGSTQPAPQARPGFLYGRVTTVDGATYEGRLRWGGDQEAFWGDYFNGVKDGNPWVSYVPPEQVPKERRRAFHIFGFWMGPWREVPVNLTRLLMARFGDIARIDAGPRVVRVTLKSGTVFPLVRSEAGDLDDGVRVWDARRGVVDLDSLRIRTIELMPAAPLADTPTRLHGTVHTSRGGDFTGFVQWDRRECVGTDMLGSDILGRQSPNSALSVRFDSIRSIARRGSGALVTLKDGREVTLSRPQRGDGNHGIYVDDPRYGRVLVPWEAFERLDFTPADSGPAYGDFPPGRPLAGSVTTRDGRHLAGRLVYDLDETETTETLDAPSKGIDYTIPFGLVASIEVPDRDFAAAPRAKVTLRSGEVLQLARLGDLGARNGGILVFAGGSRRADYVPWRDVAQIDFGPDTLAPPAKLP